MKSNFLLQGILVTFCFFSAYSQTIKIEKKWYDSFSIRGYSQVRYNRLFETNPKLKSEQGDKSIGENGGFFIRRLRIVFSGQISERVYFYLQPDFASNVSTSSLHFGQLRDAYFDVGLDAKNEFRFRIGQSKVPFGFENMQSSQNRLPLDRNDALNSAVSNERDLGVFFYWAPSHVRKLYTSLVSDGLKGSGDYGVFAFGAYNGQTANKPEANNSSHLVARVSYPFHVKNQIVELGVQAYSGKWVMATDQLSQGVKYYNDRSYLDERIAATFVLFPKPFGIQAEYNWGTGPEFDKVSNEILSKNLKGGYVTLSYKIDFEKQKMIPFIRQQYYQGGKKHELDARSYDVNETEFGIEWQLNKYLEFVTVFTSSIRRAEDFKTQDNLQSGSMVRIQAQVNF